jgi:hypothetical protein
MASSGCLAAAFGPQTAAARAEPTSSAGVRAKVGELSGRALATVHGASPAGTALPRSGPNGHDTWTYWSSPIGLKTPGASGPWSSSANCSAETFSSTSARYFALNAIDVPSPSTFASTCPT